MNEKNYIRNDENLKAPDATEHISLDEYQWRVQELIKCKNDILYFAEHYYYIISPDKGKHIIELYPKQRELILSFINNKRVVTLASRQSGKTTSYSIYALWITLFNKDKSILICANTGESSIEFLSKIRQAYEDLPFWIKPGVKDWNKKRIKFSNDSSIRSTPTSPSVRGKTMTTLIIDEMAFINDNCDENEFWAAVYPVISSGKTTNIIIVSTPNGTGNLFYDIYNKAELGLDKDGWINQKIDWWDVPGRDDAWKNQQLQSLGDIRKFDQEFGNKFLGSSMTLIEGNKINELKQKSINAKIIPKKIKLNNFDIFEYNEYFKPEKNHTYIIGADVAEGVGGDFSTILIIDITSIKDIKVVASYFSNIISTTEMAYFLTKLSLVYNNAYVAMENNGISKSTIDIMFMVYEFDLFINIGNPKKLGIYSHNSIKNNACIWVKDLISTDDVNFTIYENRLLEEMEYFEKKSTSAHSTFQAAPGKHDDFMMAFIWAMLVLNLKYVENYYNVKSYIKTKYGIEIPEAIFSWNSTYYKEEDNSDVFDRQKKLDNLFNHFNKNTESDNINNTNINKTEEDFNNLGFIGDEDLEIGYGDF